METARIMIVEDEAVIAMEIESTLQSLGYEVTSIVNSGDQAIQQAEKERPDLIIMDIRIKGDKDGIETAEIIRKRFDIPVIFSTAFLDQDRIERAKIAMPFGYILKPIQERDLKITLAMSLYVAEVDAERKLAERNVQLKHEQMLAIFDSMDEVVYVSDPNTYEMLFMNRVARENWGDRFGEPCYRILQNLDEPCDFCSNDRIFGSNLGTTYVWEWKNKINNHWYKCIDRAIEWPDNRMVRFELAVDINENKKIEEALKESEEKYRRLFEDSMDGYVLADPDTGIMLDCNHSFAEMLGCTREELIGQHQCTVHPPGELDGDFTSTFRQHLAEKSGETLQARIMTKSGQVKNVSIRARVYGIGNKRTMQGIFRIADAGQQTATSTTTPGTG